MSKKNHNLSAAAMRKAEREMDTFLRQINSASTLDIIAELKQLS